MILDDDRRAALEAEIARREKQLAATAPGDERAQVQASLDELRERLDRLEFATEIERQSDA